MFPLFAPIGRIHSLSGRKKENKTKIGLLPYFLRVFLSLSLTCIGNGNHDIELDEVP